MAILSELQFTQQFKVCDIIHEGTRQIPQRLQMLYPVVAEEINSVQISESETYAIIWDGGINGGITVKTTYEHYKVAEEHLEITNTT